MASLTLAAREAWEASLFGEFPEDARGLLLERAQERAFASGESIQHLSGEVPGLVFLIVDGLARIYFRSESGREMTVRYAGLGEIVGLPALAAGRSNPAIAVRPMIDTRAVSLPADSLARLAARDAHVAWPIARYVAETLHLSEQLWSRNVFQQMPPRVAYHLLELCTRDDAGLVVLVTQDEVAHAVGSVREVVARTLKEFAQQGLIRRGSHAIRLLDPAGLHKIASPGVL